MEEKEADLMETANFDLILTHEMLEQREKAREELEKARKDEDRRTAETSRTLLQEHTGMRRIRVLGKDSRPKGGELRNETQRWGATQEWMS